MLLLGHCKEVKVHRNFPLLYKFSILYYIFNFTKYFGSSPFLNTFVQSRAPESTTYKLSPSSPYLITYSPELYL